MLGLLAALGGCMDAEEGEDFAPGSRSGRPGLDEVVARLPGDIAGFRLASVTDYEALQPGYGVAIAYGREAQDAIGAVFLYDRGLGAIPTDPGAPQLRAEFDRLVQEILGASGGRGVRGLRERARFDLPIARGRGLRCVELDGEMSGEAIRRTICLGGAGGRFLQAQVTMPMTMPATLDPRGFIAGVALAARVARRAAPAAPGAATRPGGA